MNGQQAAEVLKKEQTFLNNILKGFKAEHGAYRPNADIMTVAQHIHHLAFSMEWFRAGAFGEGFNMDFAAMEAENRKEISLEEALGELDAAYEDYAAFLAGLSEEDLMAPMDPNEIFGEQPKVTAVYAQMDHTAHHRGALAVYQRMLGIKPASIYME